MKIIGNTVGMGLPKPDLRQNDPSKGDYVKGKEIIPKKTSDLENDSGYLTEHQDLVLYVNLTFDDNGETYVDRTNAEIYAAGLAGRPVFLLLGDDQSVLLFTPLVASETLAVFYTLYENDIMVVTIENDVVTMNTMSLVGERGEKGDKGNGIKSAVLNANYTLTLTFDDGTRYTTSSIRGATGADGKDGYTPVKGVDYFDGKDGQDGYTPQKNVDYFDGKDGTSVTVSKVTESSADGGSNVVTFSDGKTVTVKNGKKGTDGKTPVKGTDYFTPDDKQEIAEQAAAMVNVPKIPADIGAQPAGNYALKSEIPSVPVQSVNGKTGAVQLSASDVNARSNTWMPTAQDVGALPATYTPPNQTAEQVGADSKGTASATVSKHNVAEDSHNDIRLELKAINDKLTAFFDSDDKTLDELSEIVTYITNNKALIDNVTTSKVSVSDIVNNLTTNVSNKPLSAAQGVALKALIDAITVPTKLSQLTDDASHRTVTDTEKTAWNAKSNFSGNYSDLNGKPTIPTVPTKVSAFENDKGYITGYTETDPTVPSWAKASSKPTYTKSEVGLGNVDNVKQYSASNPPPYPVTSVNGKTGAVTLTTENWTFTLEDGSTVTKAVYIG